MKPTILNTTVLNKNFRQKKNIISAIPILKSIFFRADPDAVRFFCNCILPDGTNFSTKMQDEQIINATVLRYLSEEIEQRKEKRKAENKSLKGINYDIFILSKQLNELLFDRYKIQHSLPKSEKRFTEIFKKFSVGFNYDILISDRFGNNHRKLFEQKKRGVDESKFIPV